MTNDPELLELRRAFVESICRECQVTVDQLCAMLAEPGFGAPGRGRDWRSCVPPAVIEAWPCLTADAAIVAFYAAFTQAREVGYAGA